MARSSTIVLLVSRTWTASIAKLSPSSSSPMMRRRSGSRSKNANSSLPSSCSRSVGSASRRTWQSKISGVMIPGVAMPIACQPSKPGARVGGELPGGEDRMCSSRRRWARAIAGPVGRNPGPAALGGPSGTWSPAIAGPPESAAGMSTAAGAGPAGWSASCGATCAL
eukprot:919446-Heterocapsa_arctica.AAC.1